ncbi:calcium-responsive transactivator-like [Trichomycterus rosablanca]|uniref:calcium-responsive transactivator-like n=1 Tax=Trichomycterus rosablanca TaxID=2290929 RepID=UPI002F34F68A
MSVTFSSTRPRGKADVTQQSIQKMLDENHHLIQRIMDYQSKGKTTECTQYQQILHRNLVYLATIADSNQNMQSLLPAPPNPGVGMGGGGLGGGGLGGSLHSQSNLNDNMAPSSLIQNQMSNVSMMHQQGAGPHYSSSGGQHYQGQQSLGMMAPGSQGNSMMAQRPMGSYHPAQQGTSQLLPASGSQYMAQEEFYGEQYGHAPSSSEPINQHYYPDGHGEYSYQQSTYGEQSYERSFEDSSQHYYEGGNPQYNQQQSQYQQSSGQQQAFNQQQYQSINQSQSGYSNQGYGPGQGGPSQFSQYQQGQSQQYSSYRSSQSGPATQSQRSFTYEQGQFGNYQQ